VFALGEEGGEVSGVPVHGVEDMPGMRSFQLDIAREQRQNMILKWVFLGIIACAGLGGLVWMLN